MIKIGSLLTPTARYVESPESGSVSDDIDAGVRTRTVTNVYTCYKSEVRTVIGALDKYPAALLSCGGRKSNGLIANYVNWGAGYELTGANVAEISPHMSRISATYQATDPAGADGVAQTGDAKGCIIGKPWEGGGIYTETPASGKYREDRVWIANSFGWNVALNVDRYVICLKSDARTVADSLSLAPAALTTNSGSGPSVSWGGSFNMVSLSGSSLSPSFYGITVKYRRNIAEAIYRPPSGVVLACTAGVCSIVWNSVKFEELDSGAPTDTTGMDVRIINGYTCLLLCNGVPFNDFTPSVTLADKILEWRTSGGNADLYFCGEIWKSLGT